jgi:ATP-binding cassette subfamily B protein
MSKMMRLPVRFFESKFSGDLIQRINDHTTVEDFISSTLLTTIFSVINLLVYSVILFYYDLSVFLVFLISSIFSVAWTMLFMKWRKTLNYIRFRELSTTNDKIFEIVNHMPEIKINRFEKFKQKEWEGIRVKLFKLDISKLKLEQYQRIGAECFDQIRIILIIFFSVYSVIQGTLTLGMMLAISYVIGQLNGPIKDIIKLVNVFQTASIGLERMNEVYSEEDEESTVKTTSATIESPEHFKGLELVNVSFSYLGPQYENTLKEVNIRIPEGKVVAIVGSSGSGKTTLLKLLLRFYKPDSGRILLNGRDLDSYGIEWWRQQLGVVMQEGHIFSDTLKRNIVMGEQTIDNERLVSVVEIANLDDLILDLPLHFDTNVGESGLGLSTGQKQRLLIARAIYKNPAYIFFDEATSSLDSTNEVQIMDKLHKYFNGKTVLIIAHRLSTVRKADQIIVLDKGTIVETGDHQGLVKNKGAYFNLIKNQLELGD